MYAVTFVVLIGFVGALILIGTMVKDLTEMSKDLSFLLEKQKES